MYTLATDQARPLTAGEASKFLNVSLSTLYKWTHRRLIPHSKPTGKLLYFNREDLLRFISSNHVSTAEEISREADQYIHRTGGAL